jgi:hypothetical protein
MILIALQDIAVVLVIAPGASQIICIDPINHQSKGFGAVLGQVNSLFNSFLEAGLKS